MTQRRCMIGLGALALGALPAAAAADGATIAPAQPPVVAREQAAPRAFPGVLGAASALPAPAGTGYVALGYVNPRSGIAGNGADGDLSLGYTFGNPIDAVSVNIQTTLFSLVPLGQDGEFSFSVSRLLRAGDQSVTFIGAAAGSLAGWGDAAENAPTYSIYGSHLTSIDTESGEVPIQITLGWGSETTLSTDGAGTVGEGFFFGAGVGVTQALSVSVSGTQTQANIGAVLAIPQIQGLGISAGLYDVFDNTNRQQYALGVAFSF